MTRKRAFDFIIVCIGLTILAPVIATIALLVKATSNGPIFLDKKRVGLNEREFNIYKFRTMVDRAEEMGTSVTTKNDPRITPFGRVLRKTKLDEFPQLINVFRGEMSLVGPRPDVPEIVKKYRPEMMKVFKIRPGVTCLATLHLRYEENILDKIPNPDAFYEEVLVPLKVRLAMKHMDKDSFAFDLKILCHTMWMLAFGRWWPIREYSE